MNAITSGVRWAANQSNITTFDSAVSVPSVGQSMRNASIMSSSLYDPTSCTWRWSHGGTWMSKSARWTEPSLLPLNKMNRWGGSTGSGDPGENLLVESTVVSRLYRCLIAAKFSHTLLALWPFFASWHCVPILLNRDGFWSALMNSSARPGMFHVHVECSTWTWCGAGLDPWGCGIVFHMYWLMSLSETKLVCAYVLLHLCTYVRWWVRMCMYRVVYVRLVCGRNL